MTFEQHVRPAELRLNIAGDGPLPHVLRQKGRILGEARLMLRGILPHEDDVARHGFPGHHISAQ